MKGKIKYTDEPIGESEGAVEIPEEETITAVAKGKAYVMIREDKQGYPRVKRYRIEWT